MDGINDENILIGKRMIEVGINLDESLSDLLRIELRMLKQLAKSNNALEDLQKTNNLIKSVIMAITLTDEKIKTGLDLYLGKYHT